MLRCQVILVAVGLVGCTPSSSVEAQRDDVHNIPTVTLRSEATGMEFIQIPPGTFVMGKAGQPLCDPEHKVTVDGFLMSSTEVTNLQYERFKPGRARGKYSTGNNAPATGMTWLEVAEFCRWLSKKDGRTYELPTEQQWEYAARGGLEGMDYPWGNSIDSSKCLISGVQTMPVKSFAPNGFGLYDMCGNAAEMTATILEPYPGAEPDPNAKIRSHPDCFVERGPGVGVALPTVWVRIPAWNDLPSSGSGFRLVVVPQGK